MKYDSHYSLAVLIPMAIWGGMLPAQARRYEEIRNGYGK